MAKKEINIYSLRENSPLPFPGSTSLPYSAYLQASFLPIHSLSLTFSPQTPLLHPLISQQVTLSLFCDTTSSMCSHYIAVSCCCSFLPTFFLCFSMGPPQAALISGKYMLWCGLIDRCLSFSGYSCAKSLADGVGFSLWWVCCGAVWNQPCPGRGRP